MTERVVKFFAELGFEICQTSEIESEWNNFDSLRVPADHPSRDQQDTFWFDKTHLLRAHTTAGYVGLMKDRRPPVRLVIPGRCYRREATDESHEATFYQIDAFCLDKNITFGDLIGTMEAFLKNILGPQSAIKLIPHHYPFVEPGLDIYIKFKDKWMEILGSGMLHPVVIKNMELNPRQWQGWAFGVGLDRLMMLYYGVNDIRLSYQNDFRFLKQF